MSDVCIYLYVLCAGWTGMSVCVCVGLTGDDVIWLMDVFFFLSLIHCSNSVCSEEIMFCSYEGGDVLNIY